MPDTSLLSAQDSIKKDFTLNDLISLYSFQNVQVIHFSPLGSDVRSRAWPSFLKRIRDSAWWHVFLVHWHVMDSPAVGANTTSASPPDCHVEERNHHGQYDQCGNQ